MKKIEKIGTKAMVQEISNRMGCYHKDVREVLDYFTCIMVENVSQGKRVQFMPLGVFMPAKIKRDHKAGKVGNIKIRYKQSTTVTRKLVNNFVSNSAKQSENEGLKEWH